METILVEQQAGPCTRLIDIFGKVFERFNIVQIDFFSMKTTYTLSDEDTCILSPAARPIQH